MKRCLVTIMALVMLVACQSQQVTFSLEKNGKLYNYSEMITFYYPRDWTVSQDELKLSLDIVNENEKEALYFDSFDIVESNSPNELIVLYEAKLKDLGVTVHQVEEALLSSGQKCFYLNGEISKNDALFCEVIVFIGQKQYIYSYIASRDVYEENEEMMIHYLNSFFVNEAMKLAL